LKKIDSLHFLGVSIEKYSDFKYRYEGKSILNKTRMPSYVLISILKKCSVRTSRAFKCVHSKFLLYKTACSSNTIRTVSVNTIDTRAREKCFKIIRALESRLRPYIRVRRFVPTRENGDIMTFKYCSCVFSNTFCSRTSDTDTYLRIFQRYLNASEFEIHFYASS